MNISTEEFFREAQLTYTLSAPADSEAASSPDPGGRPCDPRFVGVCGAGAMSSSPTVFKADMAGSDGTDWCLLDVFTGMWAGCDMCACVSAGRRS